MLVLIFNLQVTIRENLYFESSLIVNQWDYNFSYSYLRKPVNRTEWIFHGHSASVGAYYTFAENSICENTTINFKILALYN